ncbi:MAG TPA: acetylxylan esterase [Micromonosporaceae bacterium]|nr:acetylxylan esterase [Micromonosporaceae bacterium]
MPQVDLPLDELRRYRSSVVPPPDLHEFWRGTLAEAAHHDVNPTFTRVDNGLVVVETYDVTFHGYGGHPVRAWLHLPAEAVRDSDRLGAVVQYQGYNGGRGLTHEHIFWACAGYAHLVVDTRGQGSGWAVGDTGDPVGAGPTQPGYMTRGIEDPRDYYYRRVYVDAVRAVDVVRSHPVVDEKRIAVTGGSQGGGLALAVGALASGVAAVLPDVPFLCDFPRATRIAGTDPYAEIARYLQAHRDRVEQTFQTLSYFDGAVLARDATAPALFSVALMDETCPPSTVFGAYHAYAGDKQIEVYEFNDHEGGEAFHRTRQLEWLPRVVGVAAGGGARAS